MNFSSRRSSSGSVLAEIPVGLAVLGVITAAVFQAGWLVAREVAIAGEAYLAMANADRLWQNLSVDARSWRRLTVLPGQLGPDILMIWWSTSGLEDSEAGSVQKILYRLEGEKMVREFWDGPRLVERRTVAMGLDTGWGVDWELGSTLVRVQLVAGGPRRIPISLEVACR